MLGYLLTWKLPPVTELAEGRRRLISSSFPLCLLPSEWWCAANDLPRPALLPRGHARDPQAAAVPRERGPGAPDRNGSHERQVRELLPLLLAATYQTVPKFISKVICFQHKLPKIIFLKNNSFFFFLKFYIFLKTRKFKVFYCRKPWNSEQIKLCCTIVLVGAFDFGGWGRCLHVDAQRPQWE